MANYAELTVNRKENKGGYLILAPHCDDELLACGGLIQGALEENIPVKIVFLTNGDGFRWAAMRNFKRPYIGGRKSRQFGEIRQREAIKAAEELGLTEEDIYFFGYPDRGLEYLWHSNWEEENAYRSRFTKVIRNPYSLSYRLEQNYAGINLVANLRDIILDYNPGRIFVSSTYDNHPDHWSTYNFLYYVLGDLKLNQKISGFPPVYQYLIHWNMWPMSLKNNKNLYPPPRLAKINTDWYIYKLRQGYRKRKLRALRKYRSQMRVMRKYLKSFVAGNELFIRDRCYRFLLTGKKDIGFPANSDSLVFFEPAGKNRKTERRAGADISKLELGVKAEKLLLKLFLRRGVRLRYGLAINLKFLSRESGGLNRDYVKLFLPPGNPGRIEVNPPYIRKWLEYKVKGERGPGIKLKLPGRGKKDGYLFCNAVSYYRSRPVDRTAWKIIELMAEK